MRVTDAMFDEVLPLLAQVSAQVVMPRFRQLGEGEVIEKARGDLVTVADHEAEVLIERALRTLLPGARVVGEEGCAADPRLLQGLDEGLVWVVDPLDGTGNFVAGSAVFAMMVALVHDGVPIGAWVLHPVTGVGWRAQRGAGCFREGVRQRVPELSPPQAEWRGAVLSRYMPPALREHLSPRLERVGASLPGQRCSGAEYPAVIKGSQQFAMFYRTLPWDHLPGSLLVQEAGGHVARFDGQPYRAGDERHGLLAAVNTTVWETVRADLLD